MTFYSVVLSLHNLMRWVVVILAVLALVRAYQGWLQRREWTEQDRKVGVFFGMAMDVQFLLGLLLYVFLSPLTQTAFRDFGAAMGNSEIRFFAIEHLISMLLAVVLVHMGSAMARRAEQNVDKHRRAAIWYTVAVLIILVAIPWSRPLLRFG